MATNALAPIAAERGVRPTLVDCDVHPDAPASAFLPYLESRWADYLQTYGLRTLQSPTRPAHREPVKRADAIPPNGGVAGSDPVFAAQQLLDGYGIDAAILTCLLGQIGFVGSNHPVQFSDALTRAVNDWLVDVWFPADARWLGAIHTRIDEAEYSVAEIERCVGLSDRFLQIACNPRNERPLGHPKYWHLFEAAVHFDLPVAVHVGGWGGNHSHDSGYPSTFLQEFAGAHMGAMATVSSLIFEGVFERFPTLRIVVEESDWSWVPPLAWRMDAAWSVQRKEVAHLQRKPSEYLDHFWFTTQPMVEPTNMAWIKDVYAQFSSLGLGKHLMYSSDYPHWDFDDPAKAISRAFTDEERQGIYAEHAIEFYGLDKLRSGWSVA